MQLRRLLPLLLSIACLASTATFTPAASAATGAVAPQASRQPLATPRPSPRPRVVPPKTNVKPNATGFTLGPAPKTAAKPIVTNTKLGVGLYGGVPINTLRSMEPAMFVVLDPDASAVRELRANFPRALIVGRKFIPDGDGALANCDNASENHTAKGAALADTIAKTAVPLKDVVNAWAGDNEQATSAAPSALACHAQFQLGFVQRLQGTYGIDALAGNDGPGAIEPADYVKYFAKPISQAAYFGVHAYGKPQAGTLQTPDAGYYALRYRAIHDALVAGHVALPKKGFVLTETGLYDGWRGLVSEQAMANDFLWLENQIEHDSYVLGQAIFGVGVDQRFDPFEIEGTGVIERLGAYNTQHSGGLPSTIK